MPTPEISHRQPRPFPHILPKSELRQGETYCGWLCKKCDLLIATDQTALDSARIPKDRLIIVMCPHCHSINVRTCAARNNLKYEARA